MVSVKIKYIKIHSCCAKENQGEIQMKKFNLIFMSMMTLILTGLLMACSFKEPQVNFSQEEIVASVGETIDLDSYLSVKEVQKKELEVAVAKSDLFDISSHKLTAKKSGKTDVYVFYKKNILASTKLVVQKKFEAPSQFEFANGTISWNVPVGYFENESVPTTPREYLVEGTKTTYKENGDVDTQTPISQTVTANSFTLTEPGVYRLTVNAKTYGYFSESNPSSEQTFSFGYMTETQLSWDSKTSVLSWSAVENALYRVKLDGVLLDSKQTTTSKDLTSFMKNKNDGSHTVSVLVYDANGIKLTCESQVLTFEKFATPQANYVFSSSKGGVLKIRHTTDASKILVVATNVENPQITKTYTFENTDDDIETILPELAYGLYDLTIKAIADEGNFCESNILDFGKVYKLDKLSVSGIGNNENTSFNVQISGAESLIDTNVYASTISSVATGLGYGETEKNVTFTVGQVGKVETEFTQMASAENLMTGAVVLNSDASEKMTITKLAEIESVTHSYQTDKSVFSFSPVENATQYQLLYFNGTSYDVIAQTNSTEENVQIVLEGKIEDLYASTEIDDQNVFRFKVVAKTDNDNLAINSQITKDIILLDAPQSEDSGNSTEMTYEWGEVENANSYLLKIYSLDKKNFDSLDDVSTFQPTALATEKTCNDASYTFEDVGYYFVEIFSISGNENEFISSQACLREKFYIANQLNLGQVKIGFNATASENALSGTAGYFVKIENSENVKKIVVTVDGTESDYVLSQDEKIVYLTDAFDTNGKDYSIKIVAHSQDETLFTASEENNFTITRLASVTYSDMVIDSLTTNLTIKGKEGVSGIEISQKNSSNSASTIEEGADAVFDISNLSQFELKFNLYGSKMDGEGLFEVQNQHIYLDSALSSYTFNRLASPTEFKYYNGNLTMKSTVVPAYYVLDIKCDEYIISVKFKGSGATVSYEGIELPLMLFGGSGNLIENETKEGYTNVTMYLNKIVNIVCSMDAIKEIYAQAEKIEFSAYAYQIVESNGNVTLSSFDATLFEDPTSINLVVNKMASAEIEMSDNSTETDYVFTWNSLKSMLGNLDVSAQTTYQVECNGENVGSEVANIETISGGFSITMSASNFDVAKYYNITVKATNPNFLGEAQSNTVAIYKLRPIQNLTLNSDGLSYIVPDETLSAGVSVVTTKSSATNTTGKIEITESGNYSLKVKGKTVASGTDTTYYLDSATTTWTLTDMSTLMPSDTSLSYSNKVLSWNKFGAEKSLDSLKYLVIFKDKNGEIVTYTTTNTEINLTTNTDLYNTISASLSAGTISVGVSAFLDTYSVGAGGEIFYSKNATLLDGKTENNHCVYQSTSSTKLTTPEITAVEFVTDKLENAQLPKIKISFTGNYGDSGNFTIYVNQTTIELRTENITLQDGTYTFELTSADYNNALGAGKKMTVYVKANSQTAIPSSIGSVEVERAQNLQSVALVEDNGTLSHTLQIEFDENHLHSTVGGIVLAIEFNDKTKTQTKYQLLSVDSQAKTLTFDLSDFFEENLPNGGTVKFNAFVSNFSNSEVHYLACPEKYESSTYDVLASVTESDVTKEAGGFKINTSLNSEETWYIVSYNAENYTLTSENDFFFEIPDEWENGTYNLKITAKGNGCVSSVTSSIDFNMNRTAKITQVEMTRAGDLSYTTLSWNAVENASGYILRMYEKSDEETILFEFKATGNSYTLEEIFGENYSKVTDFGKVTLADLTEDMDVVFTILTVPNSGYNYSHTYSFNAKIRGNALAIENIKIDSFGNLCFDSEIGEKYLYRFIGQDTKTILQSWKRIDADKISTVLDTSGIATGSFNVEVLNMGSIQSNSNEYQFELDSISCTTVNTDKIFTINDDIEKIAYNSNLINEISISTTPGSISKMFVGLSEDALLKGEVATIFPHQISNSDREGSVEDILGAESEGAMKVNYAYSFASLIDAIREAGLTLSTNKDEDATIYFWSYREIEDYNYTSSKSYEFSFVFKQEEDFERLAKLETKTDNDKEAYVNTFVVFANNDTSLSVTTLGIYVKITQIVEKDEIVEEEGAQNYSTTKFVDYSNLTNKDFEGEYALNLTKLFEEEDLLNLKGKFKVEFSKIQVDGEGKYIVSDWMSKNGDKIFEFERLEEVSALNLRAGNLYWQEPNGKTGKYYIYFSTSAENEKLGDNFTYYVSTKPYFNASDHAGEGNTYYIAVRNVSNEEFEISSRLTYIKKGDEPAQIYKNQVSSPLKLENGQLSIAWTVGDFYELFTQNKVSDFNALAEELINTVFTSPFTFTIKDLVNNNIAMSLRFTSLESGVEGTTKEFTINAKYLLESFVNFAEDKNFDVNTRFNNLIEGANSSQTKRYIQNLKTLFENCTNGINNKNVLFDDYFEKLQMGTYKLEYRLIGNDTTLNSAWYTFKNEKEENVIGVNAEPNVTVEKVEYANDKAINDYKIFIRKSEIYDYDDETKEYIQKVAENYVLKIYRDEKMYAFTIFKVETTDETTSKNTYKMQLIGDDSKSVSVYECDENGEETENGGYLVIYLNHNDGDSILGQFGDIEKATYKMQVYAVGNNVSASSKSKFFNITMLGFGENFSVENGVFMWTPQLNQDTTIIYKKNTSSAEQAQVVTGASVTSRYSLDGLGSGLYDYIKFVVLGKITDNSIFVDSEIYQINNVEKLSSPKIQNKYGYIAIDNSENFDILNNCYTSSSTLFTYMIYNNESGENLNMIITDTREDKNSALLYQPGASDIDTDNHDYSYKATEESAKQFMISSLGSTSKMITKQDESDYCLRYLVPTDNEEGKIAIRSDIGKTESDTKGKINARMLSSVDNLEVKDGVLYWTWNKNSANWDEQVGENPEDKISYSFPQDNNIKTIFKIKIEQYKYSTSETGRTEDNVRTTLYRYTAEKNFDFSKIDENEFNHVAEGTYLKVTVYALAMNVTQKQPETDFIELVEGGFAYGSANFVVTNEDSTSSESEISILMSEGVMINGIDRIASIDENSLKVENGKLQWTYTTSNKVTKASFINKFGFVVEDENGKEIDGTFDVTAETDVNSEMKFFTIEFSENKGQISSGEHELTVFTTQGKGNMDLTIKSFGKSLLTTKLKTVISSDFEISSDSSTETLDLSKFFEDEDANTVLTLTVTYQNSQRASETFNFTKSKTKLYILREELTDEEKEEFQYPAGYLNEKSIVISNDEIVILKFNATNNNIANCLFSDLSDEFMLQRSNWGDEGEITWNETSQQFEWTYDGYNCLQTTTEATLLTKKYVTKNADTMLYSDEGLTEEAEIKLSKNTTLDVVGQTQTALKISYLDGEYYISIDDYEEKEIEDKTETLNSGVMFKVVEKNGNTTTILTSERKKYKISSSNVVDPIYIVDVTYSEGERIINRTYTTTDNFFQPTIIGKVKISVRIKLGNTNVQSEKKEYDGEVDFNLFESGDGTKSNPYTIANENQFSNLNYRKTKNSVLVKYVESGNDCTEDEQFYFKLQSDIEITTNLKKVLFSGNFDGVIDGNDKLVTYTAETTGALSESVSVSIGNVIGPGTETSMTYRYGIALFEKITSKASVKNLKLNVTYKSLTNGQNGILPISNNSLMAGLTISNDGKIENVKLEGFKSDFCGYSAPGTRVVMIYSGISAINSGSAIISNCQVLTDISISDSEKSQLIFVTGIAFTNYATISNCSFGTERISGEEKILKVVCGANTSTVQATGIAINNTGKIEKCTNYADIKVEYTKETNYAPVYLAGIVSLGAGTLSENNNYGVLEEVNVESQYLHKGDIYVTTR